MISCRESSLHRPLNRMLRVERENRGKKIEERKKECRRLPLLSAPARRKDQSHGAIWIKKTHLFSLLSSQNSLFLSLIVSLPLSTSYWTRVGSRNKVLSARLSWKMVSKLPAVSSFPSTHSFLEREREFKIRETDGRISWRQQRLENTLPACIIINAPVPLSST